MLSTLNNLRLLLTAAWLGAAVLFSAAVAPAAFQVSRGFNLPNPGEIAGALVNRTLGVINVSGFVISALVIVLTVLLKKFYKAYSFVAQLVLLAVVLVSTAVGEWVIASRMRELRVAMAIPIEQVSAGDPMRVAFQALHGYSVAALSIAIIAALIAFIFMAQRRAA
ncbi:MAG TPA: DUF4149 domain-containing protein [Pyrinomonadaceae bacterium]|nr:DUF4149 domain-containing protein [Pyrinomonadaceae bacterium]